MSERDDLVQVGYALLMAAILLRDMASAMPREFLTGMPMDIRDRMFAPYYQEAFYRLSADVQAEAQALVDADPDVQRAKRLDAETESP